MRHFSFATARRKLVALALLGAVTTGGVAALTAGPASAFLGHPACRPGTYWDGAECVTNPPPPPPAVYAISPSFGWGGDPVSIVGTGLAGTVSVAFGDFQVSSFTATDTQINTTVPAAITIGAYGGMTIPVTVVANTGTTTSTFHTQFSVNSSIQATPSTYWSSNDGLSSSTTSVTLDRLSGFTQTWTSLSNAMRFWSLSVKVSILYADGTGKFVGFTQPYEITALPCVIIICSQYSYQSGGPSGSLVIQPNPGVAGGVRAIAVAQVRDPQNELISTLSSFYNIGMTLKGVLGQLALLFP
jgi:hypothetical protein